MSNIALEVKDVSKMYRLGEVGTGTISHDLNRWWARLRGKEDPYATVGQVNDRTQKAQKGEHVWALKDINFQVTQGEVLGIIGKNGAGKSTLLKVISQITAPTTGEIRFNGRIASLLEVGTGMHPELTGRENVFLNGSILGMTKAEIRAKFDDIMDFAGCSKYADTPVKRYSSGMKVRLGFAVAAFLEPEILIVDEVLAVGDAEFQKRAVGKMKEVSQDGGRTVLFVSHNMGSIVDLCDKAVLIDRGGIIYHGNTTDAVKRYLTSFKANTSFVDFRQEKFTKTGKGHIKFTTASILNEQMQLVEGAVNYDSPLFLKIGMETRRDVDINLAILVRNELGELVAHFLNYDDAARLSLKKGENTVHVKLPDIPFRDGKYFISLRVADSYRVMHELIENCLSLEVDSSKHGSYRCIANIRFKCDWKVNSTEPSRLL